MQQRLFEITYLLTAKGPTTAAALAERFGVSKRTIYRDMDALSAAGVPVYAEAGRGGGIRMLPGFVLEKTLLSPAEQQQLVSYMGGLAALETPGSDAIHTKLASVFGAGDSWLEVDFSPWGDGAAARALFALAREGIFARRLLSFTYAGTGGTSHRLAEPYRLVFRGQGWYLYAYCRTRQAFRFFKLTRMRDAAFTGEGFAPRPVPPATDRLPYTGPTVDVRLHIDASAAFRVWDEFPAETVAPQPDGSFVVALPMPEGEWLTGLLLSYGPVLTIEAPAALRAQVAKAAQAIAQRNGVEKE